MTGAPQSTSARFHLPACVVTLLFAFAATLPAQVVRRTVSEADLVKEPGGTVLARVATGTSVTLRSVRGTWQEATLEGWIASSALRDEPRDGFDVAVSLSAGAPLRAGPGTGAVLATARAGALFQRLETRSGWARVRRAGWIVASSAAVPPAARAPDTAVPPGTAPPSALAAGSTISTSPGGDAALTVEAATRVIVVERRTGWVRVRVDGWVPEAALAPGGSTGVITAADIRANAERYIGRSVEWPLQVLAVQTADELRPELPPGQPYVLARGPLPETGFVYLVVSAAEAETFRNLEPLARVRVRATVRSGRTRFLPTPVLNFVRRIE